MIIAADRPGPGGAKLLFVDEDGAAHHARSTDLPVLLRPGDIVVANDAATLPASLHGVHVRTGTAIEVRLAARVSFDETMRFSAVLFGAGDYRTRTEDRPAPPRVAAGDRLELGPLTATIERTLDHERHVALGFHGTAAHVWRGLARHGKAIQYAHVPEPLALWDVWTKVAGPPVAFETPSAGFALDWAMLSAFRARGIGFATLTHATSLSSTGEADLDRLLPFDELYHIPRATTAAIAAARADGGRVIAIGTTVVRALEAAADAFDVVRAGIGLASGRIGPGTRLAAVDAVVSGVHAPGESHHDLLRAFASNAALTRANREMEERGYRNHEFGDFVLVERSGPPKGVRDPMVTTLAA